MNVNNIKSKRKTILNIETVNSTNAKDSNEPSDSRVDDEKLVQSCPYCGGTVSKSSKYCQLCGAEIE